MSELRDLTNALRAFDRRLASVEECLLVIVRNSEQQAEWRHQQRNEAQRETYEREGRKRSIAQIEEFQGALWKYLAALDERLAALAATRHEDVVTLGKRVRKLEERAGEEITQP